MLQKYLSALVFSFFVIVSALAEPIMVDTRLMLLAHPLFGNFNTTTGRFTGTSSEFVQGGQAGVDALVAEIKKLNEWLLNSPKNLLEKLHQVPLPERMAAERAFMAEKREIENRLAMLQIRSYNARLVPGRPGVTPDSSILPQINEINSDIRKVIQQLKEKYETRVVIDGGELLPIVKSSPAKNELLTQNLHRKLWKGQQPGENESFAEWLELADQYWAARLGLDAVVIPVGAKDVRLEAIKLIEERTKGLKQ